MRNGPVGHAECVADGAAQQEFAARNNYEDMWLPGAEFAKLLARQAKEMEAFMAHISAPQK